MAQSGTDEFDLLRTTALALGAVEAAVIPAEWVSVEHRVTLKCRTGCLGYGRKLTCPPHVPTPDEFSRILSEYSFALLVKFESPATAGPEVTRSLYRSWLDPSSPPERREQAGRFWEEYFEDSPRILSVMLELERTAFNAGFTFALALVNGSCRLCESCNVESGICRHPTRARIPEHAVGINMKRTAERAGMPLRFPIEGRATPMALLLID